MSKKPPMMVPRDRLADESGQLLFNGIPYSGAAFTVEPNKAFSAVMIESGMISGIYRPLAAPETGDFPAIDLTEEFFNSATEDYNFPNEDTHNPMLDPSFEGIGYYIADSSVFDETGRVEGKEISEFYFRNNFAARVCHWFPNGRMQNFSFIYSGNIKASYYFFPNGNIEHFDFCLYSDNKNSTSIVIKFDSENKICQLYSDNMDFSKLKEYIVVQEYIDVNSIDDIMRLPFSNNLYIAGFFIDFLLGFNSNLPKKLAGITSLSLKDYNCDIIDIPNMPLLKTIQIFLPEDESIDKAFLKQLKSRLYDASIRINSDPLWKILGHDRPTYLPPTPMLNRN